MRFGKKSRYALKRRGSDCFVFATYKGDYTIDNGRVELPIEQHRLLDRVSHAVTVMMGQAMLNTNGSEVPAREEVR